VTKPAAPGFVVLRRIAEDRWELLGEVPRKRGLPARAARTQAILDATNGAAKEGEVYAAVLRSEWRVALDWTPPS
jgi:IS5 family transposase